MFAKKYKGVDLKRVDAQELTDTDECAWLMAKLDRLIGDIQDQLEVAKLDPDDSDAEWLTGAKRALKGAKTTRAAVQDRRGILNRKAKREQQVTLEQAFIRAAVKILSKEQMSQLWDLAHADHPESF